MDDTYDFYKGDMGTSYPMVDGKLSIRCYLDALSNSYSLYRRKFLDKSIDFGTENNTST